MGDGRCLILEDLFEQLIKEGRSGKDKNERGGIFIGEYRGPHIKITEFTKPKMDDISKLFSFFRRDSGHQEKAFSAWKSSDQTQTFVGDWHTHPSGKATPSTTDLTAWSKAQHDSTFPLVFAITSPEGLCFYRSRKAGFKSRRSLVFSKVEVDIY